MMTSKERAELRAQANPLDVTLIVGKGGISDMLLDEAVVLLDSHELVKGRVLETSGLTAREASDAICEALGAEGVACVGTKFVIWRKSEKVEQEKKKAAAKKPAKKVSGNYNPVKAGLRARKQAAEQRPGCADDDIECGSSESSTSTIRQSPPPSSAAASRRKSSKKEHRQGRGAAWQGSAFTAAASIRRIWGIFLPRARRGSCWDWTKFS